jgi:choline-glycine betaine transporter
MARMPLIDLFKPSESNNVLNIATQYIPERFNWWVFGMGQLIVLIAIFIFYRKGTRRIS